MCIICAYPHQILQSIDFCIYGFKCLFSTFTYVKENEKMKVESNATLMITLSSIYHMYLHLEALEPSPHLHLQIELLSIRLDEYV